MAQTHINQIFSAENDFFFCDNYLSEMNLENYFGKLSEIFLKISRNMNEIFKNYFEFFYFNF